MNYGEEYANWYLRLNGFFTISNFVIHRSREIEHTSDCDLLGVRPPFVYEEIGGRDDDWDPYLLKAIDFSKTIGVICEVKTGRYDLKKLFRSESIRYTIPRLGFVPTALVNNIADSLEKKPFIYIKDNYQIVKLLIAEEGENSENYIFKPLGEVVNFLRQRVLKYPKEKFGDRMFFSSILFQSIIDTSALDR